MMNLFRLSPALADAIIDMDDHGFGEGLGPETKAGIEAWSRLVSMAERCVNRSTRATNREKNRNSEIEPHD